MAGPSSLCQKFPKILSMRRQDLEENISLELSSGLIQCGIIEPLDQDKLKQIRKSRGLRESQKEFADILIKKESWSEKEVADFKSCLKELGDEFIIKKIFDEEIEDIEEIGDSDEDEPFQFQSDARGGNVTSFVSVIGNDNRIVNNSNVTINNF